MLCQHSILFNDKSRQTKQAGWMITAYNLIPISYRRHIFLRWLVFNMKQIYPFSCSTKWINSASFWLVFRTRRADGLDKVIIFGKAQKLKYFSMSFWCDKIIINEQEYLSTIAGTNNAYVMV